MESKIDPVFITTDNVEIFDENELLWDTHDYDHLSPATLCNPFYLDRTEAKYAKNIKRCFFKNKEKAIEYQRNHIKLFSINDIISNGIIADIHDYDKLIVIRLSKLIEILNKAKYGIRN